ncbi:hypothetical protein GCM10009530_72910 [Microbispora corallina]
MVHDTPSGRRGTDDGFGTPTRTQLPKTPEEAYVVGRLPYLKGPGSEADPRTPRAANAGAA